MPTSRKHAPTYGDAPSPPPGPRARTYRLLLAEAMTMVRNGRVPSVAEVAVRTGVSRATAYRYFRSRSKLVSAVIGEGLAPVRRTRTIAHDGPLALRELFEKTFPLFKENEPHMRAALQLALEHEGLERAGLLEEEPFRRGHRRDILARAAKPMRAKLSAAAYDRLLKALSVVYGIEIYVVLKDIWGASDREVEAIARWMLEALVAASLDEARSHGAKKAAPRRLRSMVD
ncbi:MAG TPA: TetR/AcrR family transcriptional regulator [Casimicrobiaceae bacterium]|nr:TetR/AcrR family transcriptional regulator [Casimicrobiaceae bacterium]